MDVVVTDMPMPGMDGSQLPGGVTARYPLTLRVVLCGQSSGEVLLPPPLEGPLDRKHLEEIGLASGEAAWRQICQETADTFKE